MLRPSTVGHGRIAPRTARDVLTAVDHDHDRPDRANLSTLLLGGTSITAGGPWSRMTTALERPVFSSHQPLVRVVILGT